MADLQTTVKLTSSLLAANATTGNGSTPDGSTIEFTAEERMYQRVYGLPASGVLTITKASENYTTIHLGKVEVLTPGKSLNVKFNGDATGVTIAPVSTTGKALLEGTFDFTTMTLTNPDSGVEIKISVSLFEKAA